jgi:hypothetical protein
MLSTSWGAPLQLPAAHRSLAARVIDQAVRDVRNPHGAPIDSASARVFLSGGSPMLAYWCEIAELDLNYVKDRARTLIAGWDAGRAAAPAPFPAFACRRRVVVSGRRLLARGAGLLSTCTPSAETSVTSRSPSATGPL